MFVAIDRLKRRPVVVLGGFMVTPEPEYFMRKFKAEYVVLGEAELSFPMVIDCIANGSSPAEIPGLAYWEGKKNKCAPKTDFGSGYYSISSMGQISY